MLERSELEEIEMALRALSTLIGESAERLWERDERLSESDYGPRFYLGLAYLLESLAERLSKVEHAFVEAEK